MSCYSVWLVLHFPGHRTSVPLHRESLSPLRHGQRHSCRSESNGTRGLGLHPGSSCRLTTAVMFYRRGTKCNLQNKHKGRQEELHLHRNTFLTSSPPVRLSYRGRDERMTYSARHFVLFLCFSSQVSHTHTQKKCENTLTMVPESVCSHSHKILFFFWFNPANERTDLQSTLAQEHCGGSE